jgi:ATP-dependent exoDNAse (exonuclease V) beta subunit
MNPSDIAIIVRNNREVEQWSKLLSQNNIEAESKLKTNILESKYVKLLLDYLEIINNPYFDEEKFINLMRTNLV